MTLLLWGDISSQQAQLWWSVSGHNWTPVNDVCLAQKIVSYMEPLAMAVSCSSMFSILTSLCVCLEARGQHRVSSSTPLYFLRKVLLLTYTSPILDWLVRKYQEPFCLCLPSTRITGVHWCTYLYRCQGLCLCDFYWLSLSHVQFHFGFWGGCYTSSHHTHSWFSSKRSLARTGLDHPSKVRTQVLTYLCTFPVHFFLHVMSA